ncbi:tRNA threonylcarbamoyladenosine biosynthesis protein TsaB [Chitinophaga rupis]|uniref:tRNA threonylcarbamoyladenosine biosynthesis protein TsaB n=1 Tax=Chitinophaga rupis TaxID=573321 RepID=A0A1H7L3R6_9BACT|nr:tRNA (adenosine(37)-N6)-threonylcarbamoyltransferase complex dimerization subunit type 1 TsaB [Chitinophaga rupis]SEK92907.1 tRNA threonylcarbamoyladenosine biosynthesis protein TsaB [Chitinophaga rupis]
MAIILNIDTATATGSVALSKDGVVLAMRENTQERDHAAILTLFIQEILRTQNISPAQLDAIAVSAGPGSYTGLRVGVATAKGLCYAWNKPLLGISTLQMMAQGMIIATQDTHALYCPLLDARRQEVYTALYDAQLDEHMAPQALILTADAFREWLDKEKIYFFGDGSPKWQQLMPPHHNAVFASYHISAAHMVPLAEAAFQRQQFADVAYFSPYYLKPFYTPAKG